MNIVTLLNKLKEAGKEIVLADGNIISRNEIDKTNMKMYLEGVKSGTIPANTSLADYSEERKGDYIAIDELINFIEGGEIYYFPSKCE